ncbi:hypothetical protein C2E23DRAFT_815848 [Lenzites betulinus]|nr:hypothetical protein C2E23DRAFT_815848 [Lenzites betulinus]
MSDLDIQVVPLKQPSAPATDAIPDATTTQTLCFTDLPEDVIREIYLYLTDNERVALATLSKALYAAFPPCPTDVACTTTERAVSFQQALTRLPGAFHRLVSLDFGRMPSPSKNQPLVLREILPEALQLRSLVCGVAESNNRAIAELIGRLPHLESLELHEPSGKALRAMSYPPSLKSLKLVRVPDKAISWDGLAKSLENLLSLATLSLTELFLGDLKITTDDEIAVFASITTLEIFTSILPHSLVTIERLFPNVTVLVIDDTEFPSALGMLGDDDDERRVLPRLVCLTGYELGDTWIRWAPRHLTFVILHPKGQISSLEVCSTAHLVGLAIRSPSLTFDIWGDIKGHLSVVRILELESTQVGFADNIALLIEACEEHDDFLPADLPLTVLSLCAPTISSYSGSDYDQADPNLGPDELLARLFALIPTAFPHLRYLALASAPEMPPTGYTGLAAVRVPWRWWRIVKEGARVEYREIPVWEGERVRTFFREADVATAAKFDDGFKALF